MKENRSSVTSSVRDEVRRQRQSRIQRASCCPATLFSAWHRRGGCCSTAGDRALRGRKGTRPTIAMTGHSAEAMLQSCA